MISYCDTTYYFGTYRGTTIPGSEINKRLQDASEKVDLLTFNRIYKLGGFNELTKYEKEKVQRATCLIADFYKTNEQELNMIVSSYSIDGTSATFFSSKNVSYVSGIYVPTLALQLLDATCLRNIDF